MGIKSHDEGLLPGHLGVCNFDRERDVPRQQEAQSTSREQADSKPAAKEAKPLSHVTPGFVPRLRNI